MARLAFRGCFGRAASGPDDRGCCPPPRDFFASPGDTLAQIELTQKEFENASAWHQSRGGREAGVSDVSSESRWAVGTASGRGRAFG